IDGRGAALEALAERWRGLPQPVIGRISGGRLWLDLRCLEQESALIKALSA
ncbi:MAG: L-seryl-tRNA(Sec) selenium transferase, partial [Serratia symbiotica]|nr:L-seryl-tRNA(Sec) selenium transferase [Serratia symbiotica]